MKSKTKQLQQNKKNRPIMVWAIRKGVKTDITKGSDDVYFTVPFTKHY
jgi:hypothetical protein